jgi:hypothetical protein
MQWSEDTAAGDWIRTRLEAETWGESMHTVVPRGFPAYARVFHPPTVAWTTGGRMPTQDELREMPMERWPETHASATTWSETAAAFGTSLHGEAQWHRVVDARIGRWESLGDADAVVGPDGREYSAPATGRLDSAQLNAAARHLAAHTATPDDVYIAVWEGSGGLVGFYGDTPARVTLAPSDTDPGTQARHREMLGRSIRDPFNNVFRKPVWQPGVLSDDISRGPRLSLPHREHILFRGSVAELADPEWESRVPWADGPAGWTESPSIVWPADRAWVLVTEVDFDSTIVGGSAELIRELTADATLEALAVREGARLSWDGDGVGA